MTHANAPFSPVGRRRIAVLIVEDGLPIRRAAERFQCSPATAKRWADRYRAGLPMTDRSSRPHTSPNQLPTKTERRIINLRFNRKWGPHRISYHLRIPRSTVGRVLERYNMPRLCDIDQATGLPVRKPKPKRYEVTAPGELVHIDIKKQGRIPDGGGWRVHGRGSEGHHAAQRNKIQARKTVPVRGYRYLHHAVDDNSRVAYSEILDDEKKETAASFWKRANAFFNDLGITVKAVMTDNGACYRSAAFSQALGEGIKHKRTKPYRPQTNGKVERFNGSAEGLVVTLGCMTFYCRAGRMTTMPKMYSEEFKRDAVALVNSGMTQRQVCTDLGISRSSLQNWVNQDRLHSRGLTVPADASERKENAAALKRIRELEMENEVLRRAAAYLSQAHITPPK